MGVTAELEVYMRTFADEISGYTLTARERRTILQMQEGWRISSAFLYYNFGGTIADNHFILYASWKGSKLLLPEQ